MELLLEPLWNLPCANGMWSLGLGSRYKGDLPKLIQEAKAFIEASKSDEALRLDREVSRTIGGHTHIAVIPKGESLQWVIPPRDTALT